MRPSPARRLPEATQPPLFTVTSTDGPPAEAARPPARRAPFHRRAPTPRAAAAWAAFLTVDAATAEARFTALQRDRTLPMRLDA